MAEDPPARDTAEIHMPDFSINRGEGSGPMGPARDGQGRGDGTPRFEAGPNILQHLLIGAFHPFPEACETDHVRSGKALKLGGDERADAEIGKPRKGGGAGEMAHDRKLGMTPED